MLWYLTAASVPYVKTLLWNNNVVCKTSLALLIPMTTKLLRNLQIWCSLSSNSVSCENAGLHTGYVLWLANFKEPFWKIYLVECHHASIIVYTFPMILLRYFLMAVHVTFSPEFYRPTQNSSFHIVLTPIVLRFVNCFRSRLRFILFDRTLKRFENIIKVVSITDPFFILLLLTLCAFFLQLHPFFG